MKPVEFEGQTIILGPPPGTPRGECGALPVARTDSGFVSVWKPDPGDLAILNAGGHVRLAVQGGAHPPVRLDVVDGVKELP